MTHSNAIKNLGYCGLNCEDWYIGKNSLSPEDMNCRGCESESGIFIGCMNCRIRKCAREKEFATCAGCIEYETCGILNGFFSLHQNAKDNLDWIIKDGLRKLKESV